MTTLFSYEMSSQEGLMSQETYQGLMQSLKQEGFESSTMEEFLGNDAEWKIVSQTPSETVAMVTNSVVNEHSPASSASVMSAIPDASPFPGPFGFKLDFPYVPGRPAKSVNWVHSPRISKLFVKPCVYWPVHFVTSVAPPRGSIIRAVIRYKDTEHARKVITRCPNHVKEDKSTCRTFVNHMIHCSNRQTFYATCPTTGRHSCAVEYQASSVEHTHQFSEMFSLNCFSSCTGSLRRRSIIMIFTLEENGQILGRQPLDIRVCACPGRDMTNEESKACKQKCATSSTTSTTVVKAEPVDKEANGSTSKHTSGLKRKSVATVDCAPPSKTSDKKEKGGYIIRVETRKTYKFLKKIKEGLELLGNAESCSSPSDSESSDPMESATEPETSQGNGKTNKASYVVKRETPSADCGGPSQASATGTATTRLEIGPGRFMLRRTVTCPAAITQHI